MADSSIIRIFDCSLAILGLIISMPLLIVLIIFAYVETGSPLYCQNRVGQGKKIYRIFKIRTMNVNVADQPTHLVTRDDITMFGRVIRKIKLDELPQLVNILLGDMSLVGPRPCLPSQKDVILQRDTRDIFSVKPGLTGFAQLRGVDMSRPRLLALIDAKMIAQSSVKTYLLCVWRTILGRGFGDKVGKL